MCYLYFVVCTVKENANTVQNMNIIPSVFKNDYKNYNFFLNIWIWANSITVIFLLSSQIEREKAS